MGRSKLSEADKNEIRELSKEGYSQPALAAKYKVSKQTIHRILNPDYYAKTLERARAYQRENIEQIQERRSISRQTYLLSFSCEKDAAIIAQLDKEPNVTEYVRTLVKNDIAKKNQHD